MIQKCLFSVVGAASAFEELVKMEEEARKARNPEDAENMFGKRKVCANCQSEYGDGDLYCRFCGAPMGKPEYLDIERDFSTVYGPMPVRRVHTCAKCGYTWATHKMLDKERFCPECGGSAPPEGEKDLRWIL